MDNNELLQALYNDLQSIKKTAETTNERLTKMEATVGSTNERLTKMEIAQENVVIKNMQLLLEGQKGMNEQLQKLDQLSADMEDVRIKVTALEEVTRSNTSQIKELRIAK